MVMGSPRMTVYKAKDRPCSKCKVAPRKNDKSWCGQCLATADVKYQLKKKGAAA